MLGNPGEIPKCLRGKDLPTKFDKLLGLTYQLQNYDNWMEDNECFEPGEELEKGIKALAGAWKKMLKNNDEDLGIDSEFTRPGVEGMLKKLEKSFKDNHITGQYTFKWKP